MAACPVCTFPLSDARHGSTRLESCRRCGGAFIHAEGMHEAYGGLGSPSQWPADEVQEGPEARHLRCPTDGARMKALRIVARTGSVVVDVCDRCDGLWLDAREGDQLARALRGPDTTRAPGGGGQPSFRSYLFQLFTGLPLEVWHPVRRRPVAMYTLVVALVVLFGGELGVIGAIGVEPFAKLFGLVPSAFLAGEHVWTLVSHGFIHGGLFHLLGNLYFLWIFGDNVEDTLGRREFLWIYATAMVAGGILEVAMAPASDIPRLGASGAVAGLMGAYLVLFPRVKVFVVWLFMRFKLSVWVYLGLWMAMQFSSAALGVPGVAWFAHIGGFLAGAAVGMRYRLARAG